MTYFSCCNASIVLAGKLRKSRIISPSKQSEKFGIYIKSDKPGILFQVLPEQHGHFEMGGFDGFHKTFEGIEFAVQHFSQQAGIHRFGFDSERFARAHDCGQFLRRNKNV
jgi:hypothetical protein